MLNQYCYQTDDNKKNDALLENHPLDQMYNQIDGYI